MPDGLLPADRGPAGTVAPAAKVTVAHPWPTMRGTARRCWAIGLGASESVLDSTRCGDSVCCPAAEYAPKLTLRWVASQVTALCAALLKTAGTVAPFL